MTDETAGFEWAKSDDSKSNSRALWIMTFRNAAAFALSVWLMLLGMDAYGQTYSFVRAWPQTWNFAQATGIAVDGLGNVYVADAGTGRIQKYTSSGATITSWGGHGGGDGEFGVPLGMAFDSTGNVYVTDVSSNRIQKFSSTGTFLLAWGSSGSDPGQFGTPQGIAVDSTGYVYVVDSDNNRIQKFTGAGAFVCAWGSSGNGNGEFAGPTSVAVDSSGNVYVADTYNNRIQKFTSNGAFVLAWGTSGNGAGEFSFPKSVAVDGSGKVYVADSNNDRIQRFTSDGVYSGAWGSTGSGNGEFTGPRSLAVSDRVFVLDTSGRVQKFTLGANFVSSWGGAGSGAGQFAQPNGVAVSSTGNVYVADTNNHRIQKFGSDGTYVSAWGAPGGDNGQFSLPRGVAVDSTGNVYVADTGNSRIQKFNSSGVFVKTWGSAGDTNGKFSAPCGVAVDSSGAVYVADTGNTRIQKFTAAGTFVSAFGTQGGGDGELREPRDVAVDASGNIFVADTGNHRVQKFNASGTYLTAWGAYGDLEGEFNTPNGLAVDRSGNVYVSDNGNHRIQKFTSAGVFVTAWGGIGSGDGKLQYPGDLSVDSSGAVYVADSYNNRIQEFAIDLPAPVITNPHGGVDYVTNSLAAVTLSGSCDSGAAAVHVNGSSTGVTRTAGSASWSYTSGTLSLGSNAFAVTAYNGVRESASATMNITVDRTPPSVSMNSTAPALVNTSPIPVTITFSEPVTGFGLADIVPSNGTIGNFAGTTSGFTFDLTPTGQGSVSASIAAGTFTDMAGNGNTTTVTLTRSYDSVRPTVAMSSAASEPTGASPIHVAVTFSEAVTGFAASDVVPEHGTLSNFDGSGANYSFELVPAGPGVAKANIAAGVCADAAGNTNTAAAVFTRTYSDSIPSVTMTSTLSSPTNVNHVPVKALFSLDVTGFTLSDLVVVNGAASNFIAVNGKTYTFDLCPSGQGTTTVTIPAGAATAILGNEASSFSIVYDASPPSINVLGANPAYLVMGKPYVDAGATATDGIDGNLNGCVVSNCTAVNPNTLGSYTVTYDVSDAAGNHAVQRTRTVIVVDSISSLPLLAWPTLVALAAAGVYSLTGRRRTAKHSGNG